MGAGIVFLVHFSDFDPVEPVTTSFLIIASLSVRTMSLRHDLYGIFDNLNLARSPPSIR
jgi:hypothetical protein